MFLHLVLLVLAFIILSLWISREGKEGKRNYKPGGRELLVHATADTGVGLEPVLEPRIASLPISEREKVESNVIAISPLFAAIHGIRHGDICHVRRVKHHNYCFSSVSLLPLSPVDEYEPNELMDCLLTKAHLVSQNGLILVSYPKLNSSSNHKSRLIEHQSNSEGQENGKKKTYSSHASNGSAIGSLHSKYLAFIVLDASPLCQGVITQKTTIFVIPPFSSSQTHHVDLQMPSTYDTRLHELYYTSLENGMVAEKWQSSIFPQSTDIASSTALTASQPSSNTPSKLLMRSSMLVVPLDGGPSISSSPLSQSTSSRNLNILGSSSQHTPVRPSGATQPRSTGTTPSRSPSSVVSSHASPHTEPLNRFLLRISVLSEPLVKLEAQKRGADSKNASTRPPSNARTSAHPSELAMFDGDVTLEVGVSLETMKRQMTGIFPGSFVEVSVAFGQRASTSQTNSKISSDHSNLKTEPRRQLARIYVMENASESILYIPPNIAFNLGLDPSLISTTLVRVNPVSCGIDTIIREGSQSDFLGKSSSLRFSLIARPSPPHYSLSNRALARFFQKPRLLRVGEVFAVVVKKPKFSDLLSDPNLGDLSDSDEESYEFDANEILPSSGTDTLLQVVFFKVTAISFSNGDASAVEPYYAYVPARSEVLAGQAVHSAVPAGFENFLLRSVQRTTRASHSLVSPSIHQPVYVASQLLRRAPLAACGERESVAGLESVFDELHTILSPCLHPRSASFGIYVSVLVHGARGCGKTRMARKLASNFGISILSVNCFDLIGHTDVETEKNIVSLFERAASCAPVLVQLAEFSAFDENKGESKEVSPAIANAFKEQFSALASIHSRTGYPIMVMATATNASEISRNLRALFRVELAVPSPDEMQRLEMLRYEFEGARGWRLHRAVKLRDFSLKTASFTRKLLQRLVSKTCEMAIKRVIKTTMERYHRRLSNAAGALSNLSIDLERDLASAGVVLTIDDFDEAMSIMQAANAGALGTPKIPSVKWDDVGGLLEAKKEILDTIQLPLQHPELFSGKGRSGVLLYGPPGTGKTLLAKAVATECALNFISVKGPELINMYIGESEKNVRDLFQRAREARPCVIFFDEIDSLAPSRGRSGDSGGVMDRIVSQLLAELSNASSTSDVFVIGATNRPDLIDPALLVPGRFDKLIFLGINAEVTQKHNVLRALTRKFTLAKNCDLSEIAKKCPSNLTGADLYALCSDAMSIAIKDQISSLHSLSQEKLDQYKRDDMTLNVTVEHEHFIAALQQLTPSVSMEELERYKEMASRFQKKA